MTGEANARTMTRARILLKCEEGLSDDAIVTTLDVSHQTSRNVRQRFEDGGIEGVLTDKRQECRYYVLSEEQEAHLSVIARSTVPDGHNH